MQLNFTHFNRIVLWLSLIFTGQAVVAQVKFSTTVNAKEAGLDETIQVDFVIENGRSIENFSPPSFKGFKVVQGPFQSSSMTSINGVTSNSQTISYVLQPEAVGKFTIEGATATVDGKTIHSNPVTVQINKKGSGGGQRQVQPQMPAPFFPDDFFEEKSPVEEEYRLRPGEDVKEKIAKNLLVRLDVNKTTCYEGEPIMATYKLCSRLKTESRITKRPSLNGFSVYDMMDASDNNLKVEKINGKNFNVHIIRRSQLFPLQAGSYTLDPVEFDNKIQFVRVNAAAPSRSRNPMQRMMEEFFGRDEGGQVEEHSITLRNNPVTITVKPLPQENKPAGFKGAVGKFTINAGLKNKTIATGDAALLELVVQGVGNLPVVNAPDLTLPAGMEAFDPAVKENIDKMAYPLKGSKTFDYTFIAHDTGSFTIPAIQFSYFDPATASYKTVSSGPFDIRVLKGNKPYNGAVSAPMETAKATPAAQRWKDTLSSTLLLSLVIIMLLGIIVYLLVKNRGNSRKMPQSEVAVTKPVVEEPVKTSAPDPLQEAKLALHLGRSQEFYAEINKAMRDFSTAKGDELTRDTVQEIEAIRRECEIALYTPGYEDKDRQAILDRTEKLIRNEELRMKN